MLPRFHLSDLSTVGHHLGTLVVLTGMLMLVPLAVAFAFGEYASAIDFSFGATLCFAVGTALRLLKAHRVDRRCSLLLTGLSWIAVGLVAAVPMFLSGAYSSYLNALFDSVSSITTTGATLVSDVDSLSYSQVVWHAVLTLAGGQAVIFIAVYMGFTGEGSFVSHASSRGYSDLLSSDLSKHGHFIWVFAAVFTGFGTLVAFGIGLFIGLEPADALVEGFCLAANAANTGGFVPHTSSLVYYHAPAVDVLALLLAMLGALNVGLFTLAVRGRYANIRRNSEFRTLILWTTVFVVCVSIGLARDAVYTTLSGLLDRGLFMALSAVTTSGMQTVYPEQLATCFSDGVLILLMLATFLGASSSSTAGGVKMLRVMEVVKWFGYTIFRAILPDSARMSIRYNYFGARRMTPTDATRAMTIMILYLVAAALGAMAFIAHGNDALGSILESVSYVANDGVTVGITGPESGADLKLIAILQMWAGRLEFVALLAALAGLFVSLRPYRDQPVPARRAKKDRTKTPWHKLKRDREESARGVAEGNEAAGDGRGRVTNRQAISPTDDSRKQAGASRVTNRQTIGPTGQAAAGQTIGPTGRLTCALALLAALALAAAPLSALAANGEGGGAEVPASSIETLRSESVESYREMAVADLLSATKRLDGRRVELTGTVYGAPLRDGNDDAHVWVNVKADGAMIGVRLSTTQAGKVGSFGSYWRTGDTVTVRGVYHQTCSKHHGELDVHGTKLEVVEEGRTLEHPVNTTLAYASAGLFAAGLLFMALKRILYGKSRRKRTLLLRWL